jgi:predicted enzyme related to lactoylglutathione lyase
MEDTLFMTPGGRFGGGLFTPDATNPPKVVNYMLVPSIEVAAAKVERLGGRCLSPKIEIPGHGHMMHILDSEENLIALWQGPGLW